MFDVGPLAGSGSAPPVEKTLVASTESGVTTLGDLPQRKTSSALCRQPTDTLGPTDTKRAKARSCDGSVDDSTMPWDRGGGCDGSVDGSTMPWDPGGGCAE